MNIFKKLVVNWVREDWNNERNQIKEAGLVEAQMSVEKRRSIDANGFNIRVYRAVGGTIVETTRNDHRLRVDDGRSGNGLYIITDDKDLGAEIGKIITLEGLKT